MDLPLTIFRKLSLDFSQSLNKYYVRQLNTQFKKQVEVPLGFEYDSDNDITEQGLEVGTTWRKLRLHYLVKQIQEDLLFLSDIITTRQFILSLYINLNNTDISDDEDAFICILKGLKMILCMISDKCKSLHNMEVVFLRSHRQERNEVYGEEIKTFLGAIGENENIKDSMRSLVFDSYCSEVMIGLTSSFHLLQKLHIIDCNFLDGEYFPLIKSECLQELDLSGSHQIEYEHILTLVRQNYKTLHTIRVDGENIHEAEFNEIAEAADHLKVF